MYFTVVIEWYVVLIFGILYPRAVPIIIGTLGGKFFSPVLSKAQTLQCCEHRMRCIFAIQA